MFSNILKSDLAAGDLAVGGGVRYESFTKKKKKPVQLIANGWSEIFKVGNSEGAKKSWLSRARGSLGILRKDMPQIKSSDMGEFFSYAKSNGVDVTHDKAPLKALKPAQGEFNHNQVGQLPPQALKQPLTVSKDNYILDGTNRWARMMKESPDLHVDVSRIDLMVMKALDLMHSFPKSFKKTVEQVGATKVEFASVMKGKDMSEYGRFIANYVSSPKHKKKFKAPGQLIAVALSIAERQGLHYVPVSQRKEDLTNPENVIQSPMPQKFTSILKFNPAQPRDKNGRWSKGGSGASWEKVGHQKGSNPGGVYTHGGQKYYVKFPKADGQALAEEVSDKVHEALGAKTMNHTMQMLQGKEASVSKWGEGMDILGRQGWASLTPDQADQAARIVVASMLTKNWDVVGMTYDNVVKDKQGNLHIVDTGGSFKFRAQGAYKPFDGSAEVEMKKMMEPGTTSGSVVGPLFRRHPESFAKAADALSKMTRADFERLTEKIGGKTIVNTLLMRQKKIVERYRN